MKISIDLENGSPVQEVDVDISSLTPTPVEKKVVEVDVKESDGTTEVLTSTN